MLCQRCRRQETRQGYKDACWERISLDFSFCVCNRRLPALHLLMNLSADMWGWGVKKHLNEAVVGLSHFLCSFYIRVCTQSASSVISNSPNTCLTQVVGNQSGFRGIPPQALSLEMWAVEVNICLCCLVEWDKNVTVHETSFHATPN